MRQGQGKSGKIGKVLPRICLMTDPRIAEADLMRAVQRLPRGSAIVVRHYDLPAQMRRALFDRIRRRARRRGCLILLAGDPATARTWGADGHHGRAGGRRAGKAWLHSAPAHDRREIVAAAQAGADVVLLSPLFATRSHPGVRPLGPVRFAALARHAPVPVIALGGVQPRHATLLRRLGAYGFAAIDGLTYRKLSARSAG